MESLGKGEHGSPSGTVRSWYTGVLLCQFCIFALTHRRGGQCWDVGVPINLPPHWVLTD